MEYYNKERYITIVNELNEAKTKGIRWFKENPKKRMELLRYQIVLSNHIFWLKRKEFLVIIEKFLNNTVEFEQFENEFSKLWFQTQLQSHKDTRNSLVIKTINPDPQSDSFCSRMTAIYRGFESIQDEYWTKEEMKSFVESILIEMKSSNFNDEEIRSLELQSSKMESSKQVLVPSEKKLFNNSQVIPRLTWLITVIYLSLIINNSFQNY